MSVPKSKRKVAVAQFIQDARELRVKTVHIMKRFPNSYRYIFVNDITRMSADIYVDCVRGNAIYMHKGMLRGDYELRRHFLMQAFATVEALNAEISFCYAFIMDGDNFFKSAKDRDAKFEAWTEVGVRMRERLKALLASDKKRFEEYQS